MLPRLLNTIRIIRRIQNDTFSYQELIELFFKETPPKGNNFLSYDYTPSIQKIAHWGYQQESQPVFSVILPTYNRQNLLLKTLRTITTQTGIPQKEFEIIVVDNNSKDQAEEAISRLASQKNIPDITYIKLKKNYGGEFARNVGVMHSQGEFIAFTDDDCTVPRDWLSQFKQEFERDPSLAGVGGFKTPRFNGGAIDTYHRFLMWGHLSSPHTRTKEFSLSANHCGRLNANVCYRRSVFESAGGFNVYLKHVGSTEFKLRLHKSSFPLLYEPRMVEHAADLPFVHHVKKLFCQGWDWYLMHKLHEELWPNPTFPYVLRRIFRGCKKIISAEKQPPLFKKSPSDIIIFLALTVVTNISLWLGKYVVSFNMLSNPRVASHDFTL